MKRVPHYKIIAGPKGFYAFCDLGPIRHSPRMWAQMHDRLGPERATREEAEHDAMMMVSTLTPIEVEGHKSMFSAMSTKSLRAMSRIAKLRNRGLRPFFKDPKIMIALREEIERRKENDQSN